MTNTRHRIMLFAAIILAASLIPAPRPSVAADKPPAAPAGQIAQTPAPQVILPPEGNLVDGDWVIDHLDAEPATLNPITATDAYASDVNSTVYEGLLERDNTTLDLKPKLAESWSVSPDHLTYTFKVRKGITFHDGKPMTARDIKFAFDTIKDPKVDAPHQRNYYQDVRSCETPDDFTIRFTMAKPYFKALEVLGDIPALPRHVFGTGNFNDHPAGRAPVGTGPYRFVKWDTGREIVLERYPGYWGAQPHLQRLVYRVITDRNAALQVFKKGELDILAVMPTQWVRELEPRTFHRTFIKEQYYRPNYSFIAWNSRRPLFADKRVRRAMTMLVDRQQILEKLRFGLGRVVSGTFYVNGPEYDHSIAPLPHDPGQAKNLLDEAGWRLGASGLREKGGVPFKFEFLISSGSQFAEQLATLLKEALSKAGIEMSIRKLEWAVFTQFMDERNFDAITLSWSLSVEEDPYQLWHSSQAVKGGSNMAGFNSPEADRIIEQARVEFDKGKRVQMYRRLHAIMNDEQPYTFLLCSPSLVIFDSRFRNVNLYPLGLDTREWYVPTADQLYR